MSDTTRIEIISFPTPLGDMTAGFTSKGLAILSFCKPENLEIPTFLKSTVEPYTVTEHKIGIELRKQLDAYFEGSLTDFTIPFDLHGTAFQKSVWQELRNIPFGQTRSYKVQSEALGNVKAIRAVAAANGANPVAILIPCHRVIGSNNSLTGYAGELWRKQRLLELESNQARLFP